MRYINEPRPFQPKHFLIALLIPLNSSLSLSSGANFLLIIEVTRLMTAFHLAISSHYAVNEDLNAASCWVNGNVGGIR